MSKVVKITVKCPKCSAPTAVPIKSEDVGTEKNSVCPKCRSKFRVAIPSHFASKFVSEPTMGGNEEDISLIVEVVKNSNTDCQTFELTSDYYTVGRMNNGCPASRPDVAVVTTDMKMSRKHAAIKKRGKSGFTLADIGSKNGIVYNGSRLDEGEEVYLSDGDTFCLGETTFKVSLSEHLEDTDDLTR